MATACDGLPTATAFPYGASYVPGNCNGNDYLTAMGKTPAPIPTGPTALRLDLHRQPQPQALRHERQRQRVDGDRPDDHHADQQPDLHDAPLPVRVAGGAYDIASFVDNTKSPAVTIAPGLQCDSSVPAP